MDWWDISDRRTSVIYVGCTKVDFQQSKDLSHPSCGQVLKCVMNGIYDPATGIIPYDVIIFLLIMHANTLGQTENIPVGLSQLI